MKNDWLAYNEDHDMPYPILKTILNCMSQLFLDPNMCGFWYICMSIWSQIVMVNSQI